MMKLFIAIFLMISCLYAQTIQTSGTVISDNQKVITSRHMGYIKQVNVTEGSYVKKGDLLYIIDSTSLNSQKNEILNNLEILKNNQDNLYINLNRYKRLYKDDLVSKYDVEQLELKYNNLRNQIQIVKEKLKNINNEFKYLKVRAPIDAMVIKKSINVADMAIVGQPALILTDMNTLKVKTQINESDLLNIKSAQDVKIFIPSLNLTTKGKVSAIIPNIDTTSHSFTIKIDFLTKNKNIYPGMYAQIDIFVKDNGNKNEQ
ncbi:efflux RND transporter periplasmic adaptor subunit [Arcobacter sp. CECT 8986]|uniref:efflux RND transporter periplasmic adaptor subunit n=1 Tax=Arcobacter sp. CECT 8986 TaxID=2044507 RepID=UPI002159DD8A|nr:efflux RND transporter periplasmic adaptor subunit [Arcobacter sp. CECT 8986]